MTVRMDDSDWYLDMTRENKTDVLSAVYTGISVVRPTCWAIGV